MWEGTQWTHPVKKRYKQRIGLTGELLSQQLVGTQLRQTTLRGASMAEYKEAVSSHEETAYLTDYDFSAAPTVRHGWALFDVTLEGKQLIPVGEPGDTPAYVYSPASARID